MGAGQGQRAGKWLGELWGRALWGRTILHLALSAAFRSLTLLLAEMPLGSGWPINQLHAEAEGMAAAAGG